MKLRAKFSCDQHCTCSTSSTRYSPAHDHDSDQQQGHLQHVQDLHFVRGLVLQKKWRLLVLLHIDVTTSLALETPWNMLKQAVCNKQVTAWLQETKLLTHQSATILATLTLTIYALFWGINIWCMLQSGRLCKVWTLDQGSWFSVYWSWQLIYSGSSRPREEQLPWLRVQTLHSQPGCNMHQGYLCCSACSQVLCNLTLAYLWWLLQALGSPV